ncbi:MAG: hypothetical protein ACRD5F_06935 [Candidatus Acidiferrales bacterium]
MRQETTTVHLTDGQWAEAHVGAPTAEAGAHLATCAQCSAELHRTSEALCHVAMWSRHSATRTTGFWYTQQQAITDQLRRRPQPSRLVVWAGAFAVLVLAAALLVQAPGEASLQTQASSKAGAEIQLLEVDPDDALMAEIDASLRRRVPRAFEPALFITQELHRAAAQDEATP